MLCVQNSTSQLTAQLAVRGAKISTKQVSQSSITQYDVPIDAWNAFGSLSLCDALFIASKFLPVSLLTPISSDLHATEGQAGQAFSISGLFGVSTSLFATNLFGRLNRRHIMLAMTVCMLMSIILVAGRRSFEVSMATRAVLGVTIGGFWSLATATVMHLVPEKHVSKALGIVFTGDAVAIAFTAPLGSYLGAYIGWRGVFLAMVPLILINLAWQYAVLPSLPQSREQERPSPLSLLRHRYVAIAMLAATLSFCGAFTVFTYFRPLLERQVHAGVTQLSLLLLMLGLSGFVGTSLGRRFARKNLTSSLRLAPLLLAVMTALIYASAGSVWLVGVTFFIWGALNAAIPILWSNWMTTGTKRFPESAGGLFVGSVQLAFMLGAAFGGQLLDRVSLLATFSGGVVLLLLSMVIVGRGERIMPAAK
jgi:predicted MFS family arabinose efflux permease